MFKIKYLLLTLIRSFPSRIVRCFALPADLILLLFLILSFPFLYVYSRYGPFYLRFSKRFLQFASIHILPHHYYSPVLYPSDLTRSLDYERSLQVDFNIDYQFSLLRSFSSFTELLDLNFRSKQNNSVYGFSLPNGSFESTDADIYYQLIRHLKPKSIIEIGSGFSTLVALEGLSVNDPSNINYTSIEPYEMPWLESLPINLIRSKVEHVDKAIFLSLKPNDILFIDSSHIIRPQGDLLYLFNEILPLLPSGVIIHFHDIYSPFDYPPDLLLDRMYMWNEQYLLESLLTNSTRYEVILSLNYLIKSYPDLIFACSPNSDSSSSPGSFYIRVL